MSSANRLIHETSPYLLQHAHNPVDWYPWGDEALQKARAEDKPILVSIGYSACHWCHVMERESFEDEETAALMNQHFINIKIDREERPDIDHIYMDAVQAMTGSGGWPLNVFLMPDGKPFYGGTYFPPVKAFNRSSWKEILTAVSTAYRDRRTEMESQAYNLTEHIRNANRIGGAGASNDGSSFSRESLQLIADNLLKAGDPHWGGFGQAPKFPQTFSITYLLRHYHFTGDEAALRQALLSLDKMIYGGIYDQLGGGFARYSTDQQWLAPHFEKMLYDNALLVGVLSEAFQLTGRQLYADTIQHTMEFIRRELSSDDGAFFSALDADTEGVEGKFYTWSADEVRAVLRDEAERVMDFYDITDGGNWEHTNILWVKTPVEAYAAEREMDADVLKNGLEAARKRLLAARAVRVRPLLDDKILLGWNALMNIACCKAFAATGISQYREMAVQNMGFLEASFKEGERWLHTWKNGSGKYPAFLDDLSWLIAAYIHLQEITGNPDYLHKAEAVTNQVLKHFADDESGLFFFTADDQADVIVRKKEVYDGATPSGNAMMAGNLHYLGIIFDKNDWIEKARAMVTQFQPALSRYPTSFGVWAALYQQMVVGTKEIVVTGNDEGLQREVGALYIPNRVFQSSAVEQPGFPLLQGRQFGAEPMIYLCSGYSCQRPVNTTTELKKMLK